MRHYDIAIIGTGPAGQKAAIQSAKLRKSAAVIESAGYVGGAQINTGTIPSKALREAVLHLTGRSMRSFYGENYRVKRNIGFKDLTAVSGMVIQNEREIVRDAFDRNQVDLFHGHATFEDPNTLKIQREFDYEKVRAERVIIATGTRPARPPNIPFDSEHIFTSDDILTLKKLPRNLIVVGGGVIGTEYACIMAALGIRVTLIEARETLLRFMDREISEALTYHMRKGGITIRTCEKVEKIAVVKDDEYGTLAQATLESGKKVRAEALLYAIGRQGTTSELGLDKVPLTYDNRGRLQVNEHYQTDVPHIYAAGDVIGFPALASTAMEQGRQAACHAFDEVVDAMPDLLPFGIYAIPEMSMVGKTEQQLTEEGIPFESGKAQYAELARGQLLGDETGMLKLLIHQDDRRVLGVHAIGTDATELIHIGQAVMAFNGTADFFVNNVFNWPTLAEAYKVAALNGVNKLSLV